MLIMLFCYDNTKQMYGHAETHFSNRGNHVRFQFKQPFFYLTTSPGGGYNITQLDDFSFTTFHVSDVKNFCELQLSNAFKALFKMRLNSEYTKITRITWSQQK